MTTTQPMATPQTASPSATREPSNLADILERVLDKGLVIAGDIRVNLLDIELLTIKLRLVVASLETAREVGIDWWEHDPWMGGGDRKLERENERLRARIAELENRAEPEALDEAPADEPTDEPADETRGERS